MKKAKWIYDNGICVCGENQQGIKIQLSDEHVEYRWCDFSEAYDMLEKKQ